MRFFNIDEALKLPQTFNVLHNALDELYAKRQEEFQKNNPLKQIYKTVPLDRFQKSFGSSIGFKQAFEQTVDYAAYPGFTSGDGFRTTISYKPFNGKVVFTWQTLLEADYSGIRDTLANYQIAWQRQIVEFGMFALTGMFGKKVFDPVSKTYIKIDSADTTDGDVMTPTKNPVFTNKHTIVKTEDMDAETHKNYNQSNKYFINVKLDGSDPLAYAKIANGLYQIKTAMAKLYDDNGQRAGVTGRKKLVATEDAHLNAALNAILNTEVFCCEPNLHADSQTMLNQVKNGFDTYFTPYLDGTLQQPIPQFATGEDGYAHGILMLDPEYNNANKGPMMVERLGFSMKAVKTDEPEGIKYLAKQAFDFFCPSWRGMAYIYIGDKAALNGGVGDWNELDSFTEVIPVVFPKAVTVVGEVTTKTAE